jgi:protocatechuate 3,4-dioxygenase beta subunit
MTSQTPVRITRRTMLVATGGAAATIAVGAPALRGLVGTAVPAADAATCTLTPEATEGPYWIQNSLWRQDITEGMPGRSLRLKLQVLDASTCSVIPRANVEIWHADAVGDYSGYDGNSASRYLRGHQRSGPKGWATFDTVYAGWYRGRAPHVHLKVHVSGNTVHTGQLFFPDDVSAYVYRHGVYRSHGQADTTNEQDSIFAGAGGSSAIAAMTKHADGSYTGRVHLVVQQ